MASGAERVTQGGLARATVVFSNFEKYVAKIEEIALIALLERSPLRAIQFYHLMYQSIKRPHLFSRDEKNRRIIEAATVPIPESRREALH